MSKQQTEADLSVIARAFSHPAPVRELLARRMQQEASGWTFYGFGRFQLTGRMALDLTTKGYARQEVKETGIGPHRRKTRVWTPTEKAMDARRDIDAAYALLEKSVPLASRPVKLFVGKPEPCYYGSQAEYLVGTFDGRPFHSNEHYAIEGEPPAGFPTRQVGIERYLSADPGPEIRPTRFSFDGRRGQVHFSDGHAVDAKYFDLFAKRHPNATYHARPSWEKPVAVRAEGRTVGIIMPMRPDEIEK